MKKISLLGSTGSIGCSALEVIRRNPTKFQIVSLAAGRNIDLLKKQIEEFHPVMVSVLEQECAAALKKKLSPSSGIEILYGCEGCCRVASVEDADMVISAIVGAAGLLPTLAAIDAGKDIALANKETLVMAGKLVTEKAKYRGVTIFPVDSEHSAIFQCLAGQNSKTVRRVLLTASGGPFYRFSSKQLESVKPGDALKHPNWVMGNKITIDSATMMNKGLEIIEAHWLFNMDIERIHVYIHPQSIVHSMVEYIDGSVIAQLGIPDMKIPIAYALSFPERLDCPELSLGLFRVGKLEFFPPDVNRFPCLSLACEAVRQGGTMPVVLNASNEVAVEAFLAKRLPFTRISELVDRAMSSHQCMTSPEIEDILEADGWARKETEKLLKSMGH